MYHPRSTLLLTISCNSEEATRSLIQTSRLRFCACTKVTHRSAPLCPHLFHSSRYYPLTMSQLPSNVPRPVCVSTSEANNLDDKNEFNRCYEDTSLPPAGRLHSLPTYRVPHSLDSSCRWSSALLPRRHVFHSAYFFEMPREVNRGTRRLLEALSLFWLSAPYGNRHFSLWWSGRE